MHGSYQFSLNIFLKVSLLQNTLPTIYSSLNKNSFYCVCFVLQGLLSLTNMALFKTIVTIVLIVTAFSVTSFSTHFKNIVSQILEIFRTWMPSFVNILEDTVATIYKYCAERFLEDINRAIAGLVTLHNNGMGYTDEFLQQVLGIDGNKFPNLMMM